MSRYTVITVVIPGTFTGRTMLDINDAIELAIVSNTELKPNITYTENDSDDVLHTVQQSMINAGEQAVINRLRAKGL